MCSLLPDSQWYSYQISVLLVPDISAESGVGKEVAIF